MSYTSIPHCDACGLRHLAALPPVAPGAVIDGRYKLTRELGSGGMGQVFEGRDVHLGRLVAIKFLRSGGPPNRFQAFHDEARVLASIRHRHIPPVHSFGVHGSSVFFVMERILGSTLADAIEAHAAHEDLIAIHAGVMIVCQIASALGAAHAAGILHRDVKPENVIIEGESGRPVLVDFGIATRTEHGGDRTRVVGTPAFMSPEALRGDQLGIASDVYSLGCLAYEVLTGVVPFQDTEVAALAHAHQERPPAPPSTIRGELVAYDEAILRALEKAPSDRFPTAAAFSAALEHAVQGESIGDDSEVTQILTAEAEAIRILVVDDDPVFARLAARAARIAFSDVRVAVSRARNGTAAVRNAERALPRLLLLDYNLPGWDGVDVLSRVRALPGGEQVSVIVMSGAVGTRERWRFSVLGVQDFLPKPVSFSDLVQAVLNKGTQRGWLPLSVERATETLDDP